MYIIECTFILCTFNIKSRIELKYEEKKLKSQASSKKTREKKKKKEQKMNESIEKEQNEKEELRKQLLDAQNALKKQKEKENIELNSNIQNKLKSFNQNQSENNENENDETDESDETEKFEVTVKLPFDLDKMIQLTVVPRDKVKEFDASELIKLTSLWTGDFEGFTFFSTVNSIEVSHFDPPINNSDYSQSDALEGSIDATERINFNEGSTQETTQSPPKYKMIVKDTINDILIKEFNDFKQSKKLLQPSQNLLNN